MARTISEQSATQQKLAKTLDQARAQVLELGSQASRQNQRTLAISSGLRQLEQQLQSAGSVNGDQAKRFSALLALLADARAEGALAENSTGPS